MIDFKDSKISYIIVSEKINDVSSFFHSKDYTIFDISSFYKDKFNECIIAFTSLNSFDVRSDVRFLLDHFTTDLIVKFLGDTVPLKIDPKKETPLRPIVYSSNQDNISYLWEGISFSFEREIQYTYPKSKDEFKLGMIVECFSKNGWIQKTVQNLDLEFDSIYKPLSRCDRVRILV